MPPLPDGARPAHDRACLPFVLASSEEGLDDAQPRARCRYAFEGGIIGVGARRGRHWVAVLVQHHVPPLQ
jgi:hypothetical protein